MKSSTNLLIKNVFKCVKIIIILFKHDLNLIKKKCTITTKHNN